MKKLKSLRKMFSKVFSDDNYSNSYMRHIRGRIEQEEINKESNASLKRR